jgi:hypothetical protein
MEYHLKQQSPMPPKQIIDQALNEARQLYREGKNVRLVVEELKKGKTDQQRKYAHACISIIAKDIGYDPSRLKMDIKVKLGLIDKHYVSGEVITVIRSTETLSREDYGKFIDSIIQLAGQMNISLPEPRMFGYDG